MNLGLEQKVAVVLAASKGLGKASAMVLSSEGAKVIIASRNMDELSAAAADIRSITGNDVACLQVDINDGEQLNSFVNKAGTLHGRIDILVNNTGGPPFGKFESFDDTQWQQAYEQNLLGFVRSSRLVLPFMKTAGSGRIINIISGSVKSVLANSVLSTAMRMGVVGMAKMLADELGPYHITVNNVAPGMILTDRIKHTLPPDIDPEVALKEKVKSIPLGRAGRPEEFAALIAFLSSGQAAYITGTTIQIDGGANRAIF
jgi:3-oxoacyl-[acyl-carrier protein] reductase